LRIGVLHPHVDESRRRARRGGYPDFGRVYERDV
jgi:hypothetical protein